VELLDTTAIVDTPERIRFRHRVAGPGRRGLAWCIDAVLFVVILWVGVTMLALVQAIPGVGAVGEGLFLVALFFLQWGYGAASETLFAGRTLGKWAMGLRVVRDDGGPASFPDYMLRNLLRTADWLPFGFGLGLAVMLFDRRLRRLGDLVAGTIVVVEERSTRIARVAIDPPVTETERQSMPPKVVLSKDELAAIEAFLQRRRELSGERAEELAAYLGPKLSERTGVVAPTWERVLQLAYARATGKDR
jgi:uncharacterized RDD family membrane protein YckC